MMKTSSAYRPLSILVGFSFFMEQLDSTIISPVIPELARAFGVDPLSLNLTMTIYLLCSLAFIPLSGPLASRYGTRTVFQWAMLLFVASSALCAASSSLVLLTLARAAQGIGAALMVPVGRMAIVHTVNKAQLVEALAWMITPAMLGPMIGPPLGGLISTYLTWHWIFLVNIPVGLLGIWAARRIMPQLRGHADTVFHPGEWVLVTAILGLVIALLEQLRHGGNPILGACMAAALAALVAAYVMRFRAAARPGEARPGEARPGAARSGRARPGRAMLDFRLLSARTFSAGFWGGSLVRVGYGAIPFLLPLALQIGLGYSALESGYVLLASGIVAFFTKTQTTKILRRFGFQKVLFWNGVMCTLGLLGCAFFSVSDPGLPAILIITSLAGFFRSVQFNALSAVSYADLPPAKIADATTLNTMGWQLAIMAGISLSTLAVELASRFRGNATPAGADFSFAFFIVAVFAFVTVPIFSTLPRQAGEELSGHRAQ